MKKKKGFTLIELIGTLLLISLLVLIIAPGITKTVKRGEVAAVNQLRENVVLAAKNWATNNRSKLPLNPGDSSGVTLLTLQDEGYLDKNIKNPSDKEPIEEACVKITNVTPDDELVNKKSYKYEYKELSNDCTNNISRLCSIKLEGKHVKVDDDYWYTSNVNVTLKTYGDVDIKGLGMSSDQYENNHLSTWVHESGTETGNGDNITYIGKVCKKDNGTECKLCSRIFKVDTIGPEIDAYQVPKTDLEINITDTGSGVNGYIVSKQPINDDILKRTKDKDWKKYNKTVTLKDRTIGDKYYVYAKDKAGNVSSADPITIVSQNARIPTCKLVANPAIPSTGWYNNSTSTVTISLQVTSNAGISVTNKGISTNGNLTDLTGLSDTMTHSTNTTGTTYYGYVQNGYGIAKCSSNLTIKMDKTAPACGKATGGKTNWTKNQNVTVGVGCSDTGGSTCASATFTSTISGQGKTESKAITIKDKAGNTKSCTNTYNKYIDTTIPTCNGQSGGRTTWGKTNVTVSAKCSDTGGSGCSASSFSATLSTNGKTEKKAIAINDNAGNTKSCSYTYNKYIDKNNPTLTVDLTRADNKAPVALENNSWINSNLKRKMTAADTGGSGISEIQWSSNNKTWNTEKNAADHTFYEGLHEDYYRAVDNAGNVSGSIHLKVKNDTSAPTFSLDGCWRDGNATKFGYSMKDNLSGISTDANKTHIQLKRYYDGNCNYYSKPSWVAVGTSSSDRNFSNGALSGSIESGVMCRQFSRNFDFYLEVTDLAGNYAKSDVKTCNTYH